MRSKIKLEGNNVWLQLTPDAAKHISSLSEVEVIVLRDGLLLVSSPSVASEIFGLSGASALVSNAGSTVLGASASPSQNFGGQYLARANSDSNGFGHLPSTPSAQIGLDEQALLEKLSRISFVQRTPTNVLKSLGNAEKSALKSLISKNIITIFKSKKYPEGVYNISNKVFFTPAKKSVISNSQNIVPASQKNSTTIQAPDSNLSFNANAVSGPALAINTFEHLQRLGYMVLSNEYEAKEQMEQIKQRLKGDAVAGVRGFDKKYYVLRKSFLQEFENPIFDLLDSGLCKAQEMGNRINLTPEAVTVILMVMADEGLVLEKRRGVWEKA
ncbi:MAG: hypothetical protein WC492_00640 [Candidatus Micrarchaeia archaeon]